MTTTGRVVAPRDATRKHALLAPRGRSAARAIDRIAARPGASALARSAPASVVTFAGVQGGAGVSTAMLLACGAITRDSRRPALAIDLAAGTRGGLGGHAGSWSQTSAQTAAELVLAGATLARPYSQTEEGVHVISDEPQAAITADETARRLLAETAAAIRRHAADAELAAIARARARDAALDELAGLNPATRRAAFAKLVQTARGPHSLVAIDLGLADGLLLEQAATLSDLHVWVVAARPRELEVARRRLSSHEVVAARELVLAWPADPRRIASRDLRGLGEARGCPVVRLARFDSADRWPQRERTCRSGLEALCRQLG